MSIVYGDAMSRIICYNPPPVGYIAEYHAITYDDRGHNMVTVFVRVPGQLGVDCQANVSAHRGCDSYTVSFNNYRDPDRKLAES